MNVGTPTSLVRSSGNWLRARLDGCGSATRSRDEAGVRERLERRTERAAPELLGDFDATLGPRVADEFRIEVATPLGLEWRPERVIERQDYPPARTKCLRERSEGHAPVLRVVQGQRRDDAIQRRGFDRERFGEVRNQKAAASSASLPGLLDHAGTEVDTDHVGALFEEPFGLRSRPTSRV